LAHEPEIAGRRIAALKRFGEHRQRIGSSSHVTLDR
jgi:hypothetical protein